MRSDEELRPRARPATNAPTIGASFATSASSAIASVKASASATNVPDDLLKRAIQSKNPGMKRMPTAAVTARNATATNTIQRTPATETDPDVVSRTTTVRMTSPMTSSATAAPRTVRDSDHRERLEVTEDTRSDAHARRSQRGTDEQCLLA